MRPINDDDIRELLDNPKEARVVLLGNFITFVRVFHYYMTRSQFDVQPFHIELANKLVAYMKGTNKKQNLYIGISPRAGKSQLIIDFCAYSYAANPFSNFIYTSYSGDLCVKHSKKIRDIVESELFQKVFGISIDSSTSAANLWKINGGGEFRSVPMGGAITGFGCFGYDVPIKTNKGYIKIGDIVKNKMPVRICSWGSNGIEYVPILNYVETEQGINRIIRFGKNEICATKEHLFMCDSGWKRADELNIGDWVFSPNPFNSVYRAIKSLCQRFKGVFVVNDNRNLCGGKKSFIRGGIMATSLESDTVGDPSPLKTAFDVGNLTVGKVKRFGYKFVRSRVDCDSAGDIRGNFGIAIMCAVLNTILFVVGLCPVSKVRDRIIKWVAVKMSNNKSVRFTEKGQSDKAMYKKVFAPAKSDCVSAVRIKPRFKNFVAFCRKYVPCLGNVIIRVCGYRVITSVIKCNHKVKSYCLSTKNHNFLVGKSQVCVHNCGTFENWFGGAILVDDFMKADDYRSDAEKQNCIEIFENTLSSRKNRPSKDPTIIIAQRLAKDDLVNYIKEKYPDEWDFYVIPAYNEETGESFWEERYPAKFLEQMKQENPFLFYSQYQQEPIAMGGGVIRHEWWRYYKDVNDQPYRRIFITADTANKTKEWNDFTAIMVFGLAQNRHLRLLDMVHGKLEIPELQATFEAIWEKWRMGIGSCRCSAIYVEDKASGTQVIQMLRRKGGMPIMPVIPEKDKLTRVLDVIPQIAAGNIELPESENHPISKEFLSESDAFSMDDSHAHDDMIDAMVMGINQAYSQKGYF